MKTIYKVLLVIGAAALLVGAIVLIVNLTKDVPAEGDPPPAKPDEPPKQEEVVPDEPKEPERNPILSDGETELSIPENGIVSFPLGEKVYTVTAEPGGYIFAESEEYSRFYAVDAMDRNVFFETRFVPDTTPDRLSPSFFDGYFDYTDFEDSGTVNIGSEKTPSALISAKDAVIAMDAYLVGTEDGVICLVISYPAGDTAERTKLSAFIESFVITDAC